MASKVTVPQTKYNPPKVPRTKSTITSSGEEVNSLMPELAPVPLTEEEMEMKEATDVYDSMKQSLPGDRGPIKVDTQDGIPKKSLNKAIDAVNKKETDALIAQRLKNKVSLLNALNMAHARLVDIRDGSSINLYIKAEAKINGAIAFITEL